MKIALLTLGTRGDVQPFIALGKALTSRGHDVVLGAPEDSQNWIEEHGLAYRSIGVDMQAFVQSIEGRKVLSGNVFAMIGMWRDTIVPLTRKSLDAIWETAHDAEIIVYHPKTAGAVDVGEATGAALFFAAPFPIFPTDAFPLFVLPGNYGPRLNRLSYKVIIFSRLLLLPTANRWRKDLLGLGKASPFGTRDTHEDRTPEQLCAVSPTVLPNYTGEKGDKIHTTGYWFLDEDLEWQPGGDLSAFLEAGEPPVYIGFGSMTSADPARLAHTIVEGVKRAGVRAILATGWGGMERIDTPETIQVIKDAPHHALFKYVSAVVHHGGAGTTAAGLRAGVPALVCPLALDQPYWGRQVHGLGCGPKPQPIKRLKAERFAKGLLELTQTESYRVRAREVANAIAKEDGVARAVEIIEAVPPAITLEGCAV